MKFMNFLKTLSDEQMKKMSLEELKEAYAQAIEQEKKEG